MLFRDVSASFSKAIVNDFNSRNFTANCARKPVCKNATILEENYSTDVYGEMCVLFHISTDTKQEISSKFEMYELISINLYKKIYLCAGMEYKDISLKDKKILNVRMVQTTNQKSATETNSRSSPENSALSIPLYNAGIF